MAPPILRGFKVFNFLAKPVDFNRKFFDNQAIFGSHKTWRGVIISIVLGVITALIQKWFYQANIFRELSGVFDYENINIWLFGFLISAGAVFGDLLFAFVKRRLRLTPGAMCIPFDQINYVIGSYLFLTPFFKIDIKIWGVLIVLTPFLHLLINRVGYLLGIHRNKW